MTKQTRVLQVVAASLLLAVTATPALSDTHTIHDPNDTRGEFDIASASHGHDANLLVHEIVMREPWRSRTLRSNKNWLVISFDTRRGQRHLGVERKLSLRYRKGKLRAFLYNRNATGVVGRPRVRRPDRKTVRVWIRRNHMSRGELHRYWWSVQALLERTRRCCADNAPDPPGQVEHRI